jgi:hypothetical protein
MINVNISWRFIYKFVNSRNEENVLLNKINTTGIVRLNQWMMKRIIIKNINKIINKIFGI